MPDPTLQGMLAEMDAQGAAERACDGTGSPVEARMAIQGALELLENIGEPEGLADRVCRASMRHVLRQNSVEELGEPVESPSEEHFFESVALAWMGWLQGRRSRVDRFLGTRAAPQDQNVGAIHQMALTYWRDAVEKLVLGERDEARRCWQRALEVGSSFGTESHPVILWTYIASFFPRETLRAPDRDREVQGSISVQVTSAG